MQGQVASPGERESYWYLLACSPRGRPISSCIGASPFVLSRLITKEEGGEASLRRGFFSHTPWRHDTWHHTTTSIDQTDAQKAKPPSKGGGDGH